MSGTPSGNKKRFYVADMEDTQNRTVVKYDGVKSILWATGGENFNGTGVEAFESDSSYGFNKVGFGYGNTHTITCTWNTTGPYLSEGDNYTTIWLVCRDYANNGTNGRGAHGYIDWYIPSIAELGKLKDSYVTSEAWLNATKYGSNTQSRCWSSSASTDQDYAWMLVADSQGVQASQCLRNEVDDSIMVVYIRSF